MEAVSYSRQNQGLSTGIRAPNPMGGETNEAAAVKKMEEQVGVIQIQLNSHGRDIQEMKLRLDTFLQRQDDMRATMAKLLERAKGIDGVGKGSLGPPKSELVTPQGNTVMKPGEACSSFGEGMIENMAEIANEKTMREIAIEKEESDDEEEESLEVTELESESEATLQLPPLPLTQPTPPTSPPPLAAPSPPQPPSPLPLEFKNRKDGTVLDIGGSTQFVKKSEMSLSNGHKPPPPPPPLLPPSSPEIEAVNGARMNSISNQEEPIWLLQKQQEAFPQAVTVTVAITVPLKDVTEKVRLLGFNKIGLIRDTWAVINTLGSQNTTHTRDSVGKVFNSNPSLIKSVMSLTMGVKTKINPRASESTTSPTCTYAFLLPADTITTTSPFNLIPIVLASSNSSKFTTTKTLGFNAQFLLFKTSSKFTPYRSNESLRSVLRGRIGSHVRDAEVFQENVARKGTYPHSIDIENTGDNFALSSSVNSCFHVAVNLSEYDGYLYPSMDERLSNMIREKGFGELAFDVLSVLSKYNPEYFAKFELGKLIQCTLTSDVCIRHDTKLAVGEFVVGLHNSGYALPLEKQKATDFYMSFKKVIEVHAQNNNLLFEPKVGRIQDGQAKAKGMKIKENLVDKDNKLQGLDQEIKKLETQEDKSLKEMKELIQLFEESNVKSSKIEERDGKDNEKEYNILPTNVLLYEHKGDHNAKRIRFSTRNNSGWEPPDPCTLSDILNLERLLASVLLHNSQMLSLLQQHMTQLKYKAMVPRQHYHTWKVSGILKLLHAWMEKPSIIQPFEQEKEGLQQLTTPERHDDVSGRNTMKIVGDFNMVELNSDSLRPNMMVNPVVESSWILEKLKKKEHEVLSLVNGINEYTVGHLKEFEGEKFSSDTKEGLKHEEPGIEQQQTHEYPKKFGEVLVYSLRPLMLHAQEELLQVYTSYWPIQLNRKTWVTHSFLHLEDKVKVWAAGIDKPQLILECF